MKKPCFTCKQINGHRCWCILYRGKKKICGCDKNEKCNHSQSQRDYGGVGM